MWWAERERKGGREREGEVRWGGNRGKEGKREGGREEKRREALGPGC